MEKNPRKTISHAGNETQYSRGRGVSFAIRGCPNALFSRQRAIMNDMCGVVGLVFGK